MQTSRRGILEKTWWANALSKKEHACLVAESPKTLVSSGQSKPGRAEQISQEPQRAFPPV